MVPQSLTHQILVTLVSLSSIRQVSLPADSQHAVRSGCFGFFCLCTPPQWCHWNTSEMQISFPLWKTWNDRKQTTSCVRHGGDSVLAGGFHSHHVTADSSSTISDVCRHTHSVKLLQNWQDGTSECRRIMTLNELLKQPETFWRQRNSIVIKGQVSQLISQHFCDCGQNTKQATTSKNAETQHLKMEQLWNLLD